VKLARKKADPSEGRRSRGGGRIGALLLPPAFILLAVLAGTAFVLDRLLAPQETAEVDARDAVVADTFADRVGGLVDSRLALLRLAAGEPGLPALVAAGDRAALTAREQSLAARIPGARRVRLLPPGLDDPETTPGESLGFAALALARQAVDRGAALIEAHHGDGGMQLNLAAPLPAGSGVLLTTLDMAVLQQALDAAPKTGGRIRLVQRVGSQEVVLARHGEAGEPQGRPAHVLDLAARGWQVQYWPPARVGIDLGLTPRQLLWLVVCGMGLALLLVILNTVRRLGAALNADLDMLMRWAERYVGGESEVAIPAFRLARCREVAETWGPGFARLLTQRGASPPAREKAPEAPASPPPTVVPATAEAAPEPAGAGAGAPGMDPAIFRAYDIRGVVGESLTVEGVERIGRAIGTAALERGEQGIVVGRDGRLSGSDLAAALRHGLQQTGLNVIDVGVVPTPALYFATHTVGYGSGVMVTGSHNPPEYNGMKIVLAGETLSGEAIQDLRRRVEQGAYASGEGGFEERDILSDYGRAIEEDIGLARTLKVVVDCGNGSAATVAPRLIRALGCEVIELFCEVDGRFPNHHPDPGQPRNLQDLIDAVTLNGADLGLAFDGDGDRLGVVDSDGTIIWPDRQMMLFAADVLSRNPGADIIYDVKCTRHLGRVIAEHSGRPVMYKTGHSLIKARMQETGALLAGEMSGHIFFSERWYGFDDALYAAGRLLEILSLDPRPTAVIFGELPDAMSTPELNAPIADAEKFAFMRRLVEQARFEGGEVNTIDGLRVDFEDGWGLVRPSNTMPSLVLRFEADDELALARIQELFRERLLAVKPDLELPF